MKGYATIIASMLAGAAVVHSFYKPDLTLPIKNNQTGDQSKEHDSEQHDPSNPPNPVKSNS